MCFEVDITDISLHGSGVGRYQGQAVFVPYTAPGDRVRCQARRRKKRFIEGQCLELVAASPQRQPLSCPHFGDCGGCQWLMLPYAVQVEAQQRLLGTFMANQGIVPQQQGPLLAADSLWHYRSRVQFKCRQVGDELVVGFYRAGSHYVVEAADCPLVAPPLRQTMARLRQRLQATVFAGAVLQVDMACGDAGGVRVIVHYIGEDAPGLDNWLRPWALQEGLALYRQSGRKEPLQQLACGPEPELEVGQPPLQLGYPPGGFSQIHLSQNRRLVEQVVAWAQLTGKEHVLDLCCGSGNFSLPLGLRVQQVTGAESYAPAVVWARHNALRHGLSNVTFEQGRADAMYARYMTRDHWDLLVVDPPRSGDYQLMKVILRQPVPRLLYVSCSPASLLRDIKPLVHHGYTFRRLQALDMFPHTPHLEMVAELAYAP